MNRIPVSSFNKEKSNVNVENPYYDKSYQVHYKQTLRERKESRELARPDLYNRNNTKETKNQSILCFIECE